MNDEFGNDFITLIDEEGVEAEYEHIDTLEYNGGTYFALVKAQQDTAEIIDSGDLLVILKLTIDENGDELLMTIEDDAEYEEVASRFEENLADYYEIEDYDEVEH